MAYLAIDNFANGLDARKSILTSPAGSMTKLINATITPGGEITKRRAFVKIASLAGTQGLAAVGNKIVAFKATGAAAVAPALRLTGGAVLEFHELPGLSPTAKQVDFEPFDGNLYVTFYDANFYAAPTNSGAVLPTGIKQKANYRQTSDGVNYTWLVDKWVPWTETHSGHPPFMELKKGDTFRHTTNGTDWQWDGSAWIVFPLNGATPTYSGPKYPVSPSDGDTFRDVVTNVTHKYAVATKTWTPFSFDGTVSQLPAGVKQLETFRLTTDNKDYVWKGDAWVPFTAAPADKNPHYYFDATTADGHTPTNAYVKTEGSGKGYYVRAYQGKMYAVTGKYIYFSSIKYPVLWEESAKVPPSGATVVSVLPVQGVKNERVILPSKKLWYTWTIDTNNIGSWVSSTPDAADLAWISNSTQRTGSGYINVALQESGGTGLLGMEIYYDKLAVMSESTTQLWACDPDPNQNALSQVLRNNGTRAAKSVQQFGSGDVLYLSSSGIRSLKARDASNSAAVTDIGSPVDAIVRNFGNAKPNGRLYFANAQAVTEPITGRFWMAFPDEILVLSYFPGPKVQAWSVYTVPFRIDYIVSAGDQLFIRSGDDLYAYGGTTGEEHDNCTVEVRFPYLDASKPGHNKVFQALDVTAEGTWGISVSYNFDDPDAEEPIGFVYPRSGHSAISASTWNKGRFALQGYSSHISMRFYNTDENAASLANAAIHYTLADDEA